LDLLTVGPLRQVDIRHEDEPELWGHLAKGGLALPSGGHTTGAEQVGADALWPRLLLGTLRNLSKSSPGQSWEHRLENDTIIRTGDWKRDPRGRPQRETPEAGWEQAQAQATILWADMQRKLECNRTFCEATGRKQVGLRRETGEMARGRMAVCAELSRVGLGLAELG
jgi:hypothetical protein